ncbi:germin-like protein subfamily 2 member 4 [Gossypium australe]|uniref:Germin-like protein n=1 Tax=Gossypium australe TaxID=47621 RepID=A0A5B6W1R0_9ROSI|nr:germin-like protein subfamily 2 member 4 [Gossypium australe]
MGVVLFTGINVNGYPCKNAVNVTEVDFFIGGLANSAVINNLVGSVITTANNVEKIPGLNTLGVSLARIDYQPDGLNPPHTHPRASEIIFVLDGELDVGFITTANKLISKSIKKGDIFVFPEGLNNGVKPASVIAGFNSQFPGTQSIATTLFTSTPLVPEHVLTKGFQIGTKGVKKMRNKLAPKKT